MEDQSTERPSTTVASRDGRRRRFSKQQKQEVVEETFQVGMSASLVARKYGISPSQVFNWRREMEAGRYDAALEGTGTASASEIRGYQERICRLERLLGQKTEDIEVLREAVRIGREKKLISRPPLQKKSDLR
jgi:transposase